jgi:Ca2+-binding EF-hand superfamily protein
MKDEDLLSRDEVAKLHLQKRKEQEELAKSLTMAANDAKSLKVELIKKFGSATAAWRYGLDVTGIGKIGFVPFTKACQAIGFTGDTQKCFREFDDDDSGVITFNEFEPKWFKCLAEFQEKLLDRYKTYESAWKALDDNGNNQLECHEFVAVCAEIGYSGSEKEAKQLYRQLLKDQGRQFLALEDLSVGGIVVKAVTGLQMTMNDDDLLSRDEQAKRHLQRREEERAKEKAKDKGASDWASLKEALTRKFGTITAAWRNNLDKGTTGKLSFVVFTKCARDVSFNGNIKACFEEMDDDGSGIITFNEVDHDVCSKLREFHSLLIEKYGSYDEAWRILDANGNRMLEQAEVVDLCNDLGYAGDPAFIFKQHKEHQGATYLVCDDLKAVGRIVTKADVATFNSRSPTNADASFNSRSPTNAEMPINQE